MSIMDWSQYAADLGKRMSHILCVSLIQIIRKSANHFRN